MTKTQKSSLLSILMAAAGLMLVAAVSTSAQMGPGMMDSTRQGEAEANDHTAREEAEGKAIWEKFQKKETSCDKLSDENFSALGEYFMGLMMGDNHAAMNQMMTNMMGEEGEEAMHVVMGKRLSGCDISAALPAEARGFMPMMQIWGGWGGPWSGLGPMMGTNWDMFDAAPSGRPASLFLLGWFINLLWWFLVIVGIVAIVRWLIRRGKGGSAMDILKERYAKGEITKQRFEEMKKDVS